MFTDKRITAMCLVGVVAILGVLAVCKVEGAAIAATGMAGAVGLALMAGLKGNGPTAFILACLAFGASACAAAHVAPRPAAYEAELVACSERAKSLAESITCENEVRGRYGRQPRRLPKDGGAE